jgi:hypothetical protein
MVVLVFLDDMRDTFSNLDLDLDFLIMLFEFLIKLYS